MGIENHDATMPLDAIKALDVPAAGDAALFLWTPASLMPDGLAVVAAWGFDYKTNVVWVKDKIGMGNYVRTQQELLLIATRGNMPHSPAGASLALPDLRAPPCALAEARRGVRDDRADVSRRYAT